MPDYLCCKITLDIFRDPVIVPSGVTYERAVILDHLQKVMCWCRMLKLFIYPHVYIYFILKCWYDDDLGGQF